MRTDSIFVRLSVAEKQAVTMLAQIEERTPSDIVRRLIRQAAKLAEQSSGLLNTQSHENSEYATRDTNRT